MAVSSRTPIGPVVKSKDGTYGPVAEKIRGLISTAPPVLYSFPERELELASELVQELPPALEPASALVREPQWAPGLKYPLYIRLW